MKTLYCGLFLLVVLASSCTKDDVFNTEEDINQLSNNPSLKTSRSVIEVYPDYPYDTQNLIDAFALAKACGSVVKLMPGTFKIDMIEVKEFNGTLTGSGKGITILTNIPDLTPDEVIGQNKLPALITFIGGNVSVSNMSVRLSDGFSWIGDVEGKCELNLLLFSDYSTDFTPAKKFIRVNLNNVEVTSIEQFHYPWYCFTGAKFGPDMLRTGNILVPRSNIDVTVNNSSFSNLTQGILVQGCKRGNIMIGVGGGNVFSENVGGLWVLENMGVNVKIMRNEFNVPAYAFDGIDLNAYDRGIFEYAPSIIGTFEVRNNHFFVLSEGFGLYDNWRYDHPENPVWMKMIWDNNTFNVSGSAYMGRIFGIKDAIFLNNKITCEETGGHLGIYGSWLDPETDPDNYWRLWTENCKFINNHFMQEGFIIDLYPTTKNCLILGDLTNVTVNDAGVNNRIIKIGH